MAVRFGETKPNSDEERSREPGVSSECFWGRPFDSAQGG
jgi:hypothetical protein